MLLSHPQPARRPEARTAASREWLASHDLDQLAEMYDISEANMSYRHGRGVARLQRLLAGMTTSFETIAYRGSEATASAGESRRSSVPALNVNPSSPSRAPACGAATFRAASACPIST